MATSDRRAHVDELLASLRADLSRANEAREVALPACRRTIRHAGSAIRAIHRRTPEVYESEVAKSAEALRVAHEALAGQPAVAHAGFLHDAEKEYAEARLCRAMIDGTELPSAADLGVMGHSWMRGLAEAASELRRNVLDRLREGDLATAEALLETMDDVYDVLASVDFPDALTGGLRRTVDSLRAVTERTRGDVTTTVLQTRLQRAIEDR